MADSFDAGAYVDQAARLLGLTLEEAWRPGVIENLERGRAIVAPLLDFTLADDLDPAPVYHP